MNTATQQYSRHVSVPSDEGVRVDKAITIVRPISEVYSFWRDFKNLPRFMRHLESVTVRDDLHSHWAVKTLGGKIVEWDAEIIEQRANEMISWRSTPGADVDNAGSVWFTSVPGGDGTLVRIELKYLPPAGKAGALVAKIFRRDAESEIENDLRRMKAFLETGQLPEETNRFQQAAETARKAAKAADTCVRNNPWATVASAAIFGFALGYFLTGRTSSRKKMRDLCEDLDFETSG
jgi:uncharacterized membrane protein